MNSEVFDLVRIKPFKNILGITSARFTQKLHKHSIRGFEQGFDLEEKLKIKNGLFTLSEMLRQEAEKIDTVTAEVFHKPKSDKKKLCRQAE